MLTVNFRKTGDVFKWYIWNCSAWKMFVFAECNKNLSNILPLKIIWIMTLTYPLQAYCQTWYSHNIKSKMATSHVVLIVVVSHVFLYIFVYYKCTINLTICKTPITLRLMYYNNHFLTIRNFFSPKKRTFCTLSRVGHGKWVSRLSYLWFPDIYNSFSDKFICNIQYTLISYQSRENLKEEKKVPIEWKIINLL